ncbi:MAG: hypothetical protein KAG14_02080 [Mycoplasmataceae bacterium]|nr:hypothetical protein [Mycoplasmataceae bacterium]
MQNTKNRKRLEFLLEASKQELIQADNKTGWATAIYSAVIAAVIALGIYLGDSWLFLGLVLGYLCMGFFIVFVALIPKVSLRKQDIKQNDGVNIISISDNGIKNVLKISEDNYEESLMETIKIYSKLATKKYRLIKVSFLLLFPPFVFWILCKIILKYLYKNKKRSQNG